MIGYTMPNIDGIRWKGNRRKGRIEARELIGDGYICVFGKRKLDELSDFPDEKKFPAVVSIVQKSREKKS